MHDWVNAKLAKVWRPRVFIVDEYTRQNSIACVHVVYAHWRLREAFFYRIKDTGI